MQKTARRRNNSFVNKRKSISANDFYTTERIRLVAAPERLKGRGIGDHKTPVFIDVHSFPSRPPYSRNAICPCPTRTSGREGGWWVTTLNRKLDAV